MNDQVDRSAVAGGLHDVAKSLEDIGSCIRDGADIGTAMQSLRGAGSCLHLLEMTLLHVDQIEMRSET